MAKLVSKTYGEALYELAVESKALETIAEEVQLIKQAFAENEELRKVLNHPKISKEDKITLVESIFKGRLSDEVVGFLVLLVSKGRQGELDAILQVFEEKVREYKNIGVVFVTSAIELSEEQQKQIRKKLLNSTKYVQLEMNYSVDKALIGGLVIRIGDRIVDSSIRTKLSNMSRELQKLQLA